MHDKNKTIIKKTVMRLSSGRVNGQLAFRQARDSDTSTLTCIYSRHSLAKGRGVKFDKHFTSAHSRI